MKILNKLQKLLSINKELLKYSKNFNDIILDCTKNNDILKACLLSTIVPKVIKLNSHNSIKLYKCFDFYDTFSEASDSINPDDSICLLAIDNLSFIEDIDLCEYLTILNTPIISFKDLGDSFKVKSTICEEVIEYNKFKSLSCGLFVYKTNL